MKRRTLFVLWLLNLSAVAFAGGILTNTNQSISFLRMIARGAVIDIDGVYYNPAGLVYLPEGMYLSLNVQSAYQTRAIASTYFLFPGTHTRNYKANVAAPVLPSLQAAYVIGDWAFSGSFAVVGGGGNANFKTGLPMFDRMAAGFYYQGTQTLPPEDSFRSAVEGAQYIFGGQLGASYRISDNFAAFAGMRVNYMTYSTKGSVSANLPNGTEIFSLGLDMTQKAIGITPVVGVDAKFGNWNIGLKYEFLTKAKLKNATTMTGSVTNPALTSALAPYEDGKKIPNDIPAFLQAAVAYHILPNLCASVEYHHFYDKQAEMGLDQKQNYLTGGTDEYLAGVEWEINPKFAVSAGWQKTNYGLADDFQSDSSFSCDSYSIGLGGAWRLNDKMKLNVAYFWTTYDDYTKDASTQQGISKDVYSRTNKVFGIGLDYRF